MSMVRGLCTCLILALTVAEAGCSSSGVRETVPKGAVQLATPQSVSPGLIAPAPMVKTTILPASAMRSPAGSGITAQSDIQGLGYSQIPGSASYAAAAPDGSLWVLSDQPAGPDKYIWHYSGGSWTNISGLASRLSVAPNGTLYVMNSGGGAYSYSAGAWTAFGGGCRDLTAAADGTLYVISNGGGADGAIWHYANGAWTQQPGSGDRLAASWDTGTYSNPAGTITPGGFYVINSLGSIYYLGASGYIQIPGTGSAVAPMNGGLFVLGYPTNPNGNTLYYYDLSNPGWNAKGGAGVSISTDGKTLYVISSSGTIYYSQIAQISTAIVITVGGTYSGTWQSFDPAIPAVQIMTTDPVTLTNCTIRSKADLIQAVQGNAHVTITNCRGYGFDPVVAGQARGSFFYSWQVGSLRVEHNYIEATSWGVLAQSSIGWTTSGPILIRYNQAKNLDGAPSDGKGGRDLSNLGFDGGESNGNHFVILDKHENLVGAEIAWNQVVIDPPPAINSIGDVINIFRSSGTPASPIQVHDNFISGGYPAHPYVTQYFGAGIITDGNAVDTASTSTAYVKIHDNQVVAHPAKSIVLNAGHDAEVYSNRVVSSGQYPDGSWYDGYTGFNINDNYGTGASVFFNNSAHDNVAGVRIERSNANGFVPPPVRQDYVFFDCTGGLSGPTTQCVNNASLPDPITSATEANELTLWQQKLNANGITLGPTAVARRPLGRR